MDFRRFGTTYYVRMDRGDEIISGILQLCRAEGIGSATFQGIGGCDEAEIQTFLPASGTFETERFTGLLEQVSLSGNVITDEDGAYYHHTHGMIAYKSEGAHHIAGGHMKSLTVRDTAEIELRPVIGGTIGMH